MGDEGTALVGERWEEVLGGTDGPVGDGECAGESFADEDKG